MGFKFKKRLIARTEYEAASACDVNNDGILDIVCGEYWYEGPNFIKKHKICDIQFSKDNKKTTEGYKVGYYDDFANYPMDVNGDGYLDIVTGGWTGQTLRWRENPGKTGGTWKVHDIKRTGNIEVPMFYDIDGDGDIEILPNCPAKGQYVFKLKKDREGKGTGDFDIYKVTDTPMGHGMGFGDINNDGKTEIITNYGWYEQPKDGPYAEKWKFHRDFQLTSEKLSLSVPVLVCDVNGDGLNDIIFSNCHKGYGLFWMEQLKDTAGRSHWFKHPIDMTCSQCHDMKLADIDNDGKLELVTGKRYKAHNGNDDGSDDAYGIYYYKLNKGCFQKHIIDYGKPGETTGCGIYYWIEDVTGNGYKDIIAPGKDGLYLFENTGREE